MGKSVDEKKTEIPENMYILVKNNNKFVISDDNKYLKSSKYLRTFTPADNPSRINDNIYNILLNLFRFLDFFNILISEWF